MYENKEIIEEIIAIEWHFFDAVHNIGGRASCQDDWKTFHIMRSSQFSAWSRATLKSRLDDLKRAHADGRNPLTEKYGYMMCISDPAANVELARRLPAVSDEKRALCRKIVDRLLPQNERFARNYPHLARRARPLRTSDERPNTATSIETYQLGELWTCSMMTLELLDKDIENLEKSGVSYAEEVIKNSLIQRGFASLEDAENYLAHR